MPGSGPTAGSDARVMPPVEMRDRFLHSLDAEEGAGEFPGNAPTSSSAKKATVLVVGLGFAGVATVVRLAGDAGLNVVAVDRKDCFEFTPGALHALSNCEARPAGGGGNEETDAEMDLTSKGEKQPLHTACTAWGSFASPAV